MSDNFEIGIVDTKTSNIQSVINACKCIGFKIEIIDEEKSIKNLQGLLIPGVGSFNAVMNNLRQKKIDQVIFDFIDTGKPLLFICIGMQILFETSEEHEDTKGLGIINGKVKKIPKLYNSKINKVPIIGWNNISLKDNSQLIKADKAEDSYYYFIHSYYADLSNQDYVLSTSLYNEFEYCSALKFKNIYATFKK